jgi:hypothetical protein
MWGASIDPCTPPTQVQQRVVVSTTRIHDHLIPPRHSFGNKELFDPLLLIEASPSAILHPAEWKHNFIMNGHAVDMHSPVRHSQY